MMNPLWTQFKELIADGLVVNKKIFLKDNNYIEVKLLIQRVILLILSEFEDPVVWTVV